MTNADPSRLHGHSVLVRSMKDRRNPPTAVRGTIDARSSEGGSRSRVRLVLEFPDMFTVPAHQGVIELSDAEVERLLASERTGVFEFTINQELDANPPGGGWRTVPQWTTESGARRVGHIVPGHAGS